MEVENLQQELDDILEQIGSESYSDEEILNNMHRVSIEYKTELKEICENMRL